MKIEPMKRLVAVALLAIATTSAVYGGIVVGNPADTVRPQTDDGFYSERDLEGPWPLGVWWEQRGLDVRSGNSQQSDKGAFVKLGDIKGMFTASDNKVEGHIDSSDVALLMSYYGKPQGDVNGDGKSDVKDVATLLDWIGKPRIEFLLESERGPEDSDDSLSWNDGEPAPKAASQLDGGRN